MAKLTRKVDDAASDSILLQVRTNAAYGDIRRYRSQLGPFGATPIVVRVTPEQADMLRSDPLLIVEDVQ
ncbi:MAG: hypothetical protein PHC35_01705 [Deltaproteobacteria bacterium]|nr:hypothetical protein [Deltaproteobacteria bacterium]